MLASIFFSSVAVCMGQNKSLSIGGKMLNNIDIENETWSPGFGGQVVYRLTKHSGLESGLYYSTERTSFYYSTPVTSFAINVSERWLALPLFYRFDSRIINVAVGPQLEYFAGWKDRTNNSAVTIDSYNRESFRVAVSAALSKTIHLSGKWLLEPEAKVNFYPEEEHGLLGINLALRRKLF
ncbi:MAG: hypothetical protein EOO10_11100 [Chitinophagaceae bacterium]|nr:MAG: hypothetical protein EOO10_11100 [Chitinophagaceae bacterium]